jgi:hypothetical protein
MSLWHPFRVHRVDRLPVVSLALDHRLMAGKPPACWEGQRLSAHRAAEPPKIWKRLSGPSHHAELVMKSTLQAKTTKPAALFAAGLERNRQDRRSYVRFNPSTRPVASPKYSSWTPIRSIMVRKRFDIGVSFRYSIRRPGLM